MDNFLGLQQMETGQYQQEMIRYFLLWLVRNTNWRDQT